MKSVKVVMWPNLHEDSGGPVSNAMWTQAYYSLRPPVRWRLFWGLTIRIMGQTENEIGVTEG